MAKHQVLVHPAMHGRKAARKREHAKSYQGNTA